MDSLIFWSGIAGVPAGAIAAVVYLWMTRKRYCSVDQAVLVVFGGVGACSPEAYDAMLNQAAYLAGVRVDEGFRKKVREVLSTMPCPID